MPRLATTDAAPNERNERLFLDPDGQPVCFYIEDCKDKSNIGIRITEHGGSTALIPDERSILLFNDNVLRDGKIRVPPRPVYRVAYIADCIAARSQLNLDHYRLNPSPSASSSSSSSSSSSPTMSELFSPQAPSQFRKRFRVSQSGAASTSSTSSASSPSSVRLPAALSNDHSETPPRQKHSPLREAPRSTSKRAAFSRLTPAHPTTKEARRDRVEVDVDHRLPLSPVTMVVEELMMRTQLPAPVIYHALIVVGGDPDLAIKYLEYPFALPHSSLSRVLGFEVWSPGEDKVLQSDDNEFIDRIISDRGNDNVNYRLNFLDPQAAGL